MKLNPFFAVLAIVFVVAIFPSSAFALRNAERTLTEVPFDGGLSLLVAAGVGYAAKKGHSKRNKDKKDSL